MRRLSVVSSLRLLLSLSLLALSACSAGPVITDFEGVANTPANRAVLTPDRRETTLQGMAPSNVLTDAAGANIQSSGQPRVLTLSIDHGDGRQIVATLNDPSDTEFSGFRMSPDGSIEIASFGATASSVLAVQNEAVIQSLLTAEKITAEQAATIRAAISAGATVAQAIAEVAGRAIVPVP